MHELAKQLYELSIQYEIAEKAGNPTIGLAKQIFDLRGRLNAAARGRAILQPTAPRREDDGDILFA